MIVRPRRDHVTLEAETMADAVLLGRLEAMLDFRGVAAAVATDGDRPSLRLPYPAGDPGRGRDPGRRGERPAREDPRPRDDRAAPATVLSASDVTLAPEELVP